MKMQMKGRTTAALTLAATALVAAGCGSSKSSSTSKASNASNASSAYPGEATSSPSPASTATTPAAGSATVVTAKHDSKLGTVLAAGPKKLTVYMFEADKNGVSNCSGACAAVWPPVTTAGSDAMASGSAMSADLGTIKRSDGTTQVTYKGHPLYYFAKDKDSGDAYGQGIHGFGADWYALKPSGSKLDNS